MITYLELKGVDSNVDKTFKCDECDAEFKGFDIFLNEKSNNVDFPLGGFVGVKIIKHDNKEYVMHCPNCTHVSLFGFDLVE